MKQHQANRFTAIWQLFCRMVVRIFYRRFEISGAEHLPVGKGLILCANHVNALADPVIVQAAMPGQLDTAKIVVGSLLFTLFWGVQSALVYYGFGLKWTMAYLMVLTISATLAVKMRGRYGQNLEDVRVFFKLMRKNDLKRYLLDKRRDIEVKLAQLVRLARQLAERKNEVH